jgi:hypothetical protein
MRRWWKSLGLLAGGLVGLGGILSSASGQYPPPGAGGYGMPPGGGMVGPPPGMGMPGMAMAPPGMMPPGMGMPTGGAPMGGPPPGAFGGNPNLGGRPAEFPNPAQPSQEPSSPFTLKEDGMPNAFNTDQYPYVPLRFQMSAGYTFLWFKAGSYPALATTGSVNDAIPGALNQPNTSILAGGAREPGLSNAFRSSFVYWLKDPECFSLVGDFFIMEQRSVFTNFNSDALGNPVLARPFFNPNTIAEDADPRSLPGISRTTMTDSVRTRLMGSDVNLMWHSSPNLDGAHFAFLAGFRWFRLDERYQSYDTTTDIGGGGFYTTISDTFTTYNQFFGGQLGFEYKYRMGRFSLEATAKAAYGPNYQTIKIAGDTSILDLTTLQTFTSPQGLFAQPSNVGNYTKTQFAALIDTSIKANFEITEHLKFQVGYTFMYLNNSVRPGDQMDRSINTQQLPIGAVGLNPTPPLLPGPPSFRQSAFSVNMLTLGLEFCF